MTIRIARLRRAVLLALVLAAPAAAQPTMAVRGVAELEKPADELRMSIGVVTEGEDADETLAENSEAMRAVVKAVERVGLTDEDYETGRFQIQPRYQQRPRQPAADWRPRIVGYRVSNTLEIETTRIDLAGDVIEAANEAGANAVDSISFGLAEPRVHRAEAIATATTHAMDDARVLADAAGLRLVRIVSISLDGADATPVRRSSARAMAAAEMVAADAAPPIDPGDVTIRATVSITYEIAPAG